MKDADDRMRNERREAKRAECFGRLVLRNLNDEGERRLLDHAERTAGRLTMHWEKEIAWLAAALDADGVDETTLTGLGFDHTEVRHATIVRPRKGETATNYAKRITAYNQPETFEVAAAMLADPASKNPTIPQNTTENEREEAIERLQKGMRDWRNQGGAGARPPAGGVADDRPTAPGLSQALDRLEHHNAMSKKSLGEMLEGPGKTNWGIIERLSDYDIGRFLVIGAEALQLTAAIMVETATLAKEPATKEERDLISKAELAGEYMVKAIAIRAGVIAQIANRWANEEPEETDRVH